VSANELSHYLIENHSVSNKSYSTGRPKIYFDIVIYLEFLQRKGILTEQKKDRNDCIYEVISTNIQDNVEPIDGKAKDYDEIQEDLQMTLF
jgi:hypothetical protein